MEPRRLLTSVAASFDPNGPNHSLVYDFDTDVSASLVPADIEAFDLKSATRIAPADTTLAFTAGDVATLALDGVTYPAQWGARAGLLADGNYEAILSEAAVSPPLPDEHRLNFHFYQGDIAGNNGAAPDRTVNINDQSVLFAHYNQPGTYFQGDLNYDGTINFGDYAILASRWGSTLHAPLAAPYAVQVGSQTTDSLLVEWTAPQWPGGATPDGYRIYRSEDGVDFGSTFIAAVPHAAGQSGYAWEDTDLRDGRKYWYRIRAYTTAGGNTHTTEKKWGVTTLLPPTDVTASLLGNGQVQVKWNAASDRHEEFIVNLYHEAGGRGGLSLRATHTVGRDVTSHTFSNVTEEVTFASVQARSPIAQSSETAPTKSMFEPSGPWTDIPIPPITQWNPPPDPITGWYSSDNEVTFNITPIKRHTWVIFKLSLEINSTIGEQPASFEFFANDHPLNVTPGQWNHMYPNSWRHDFGQIVFSHEDTAPIEIKIKPQGMSSQVKWTYHGAEAKSYFPFVAHGGGGEAYEDGYGSVFYQIERIGLIPADELHQPILQDALVVHLAKAGGSTAEPKDFDSIFPLTQTIAPMATIFVDSYRAKDDDVVEAEMETLNVAIKHSAAYAFAPATQPVALAAGDDDFVIRSFRVSFNDQGVRRDIGAQLNYTDGGAAHWADNDGDGEVAGAGQPLGWLAESSAEHSYPVSYARSSAAGENRITAGAVFAVEGNPRPGVKIRGEGMGPGGGEFIGDAMIVPLPQNPAMKLVAINDASSQPLPATIDKGRLTIHWRLIKPKQNADPENLEYGDSINPIYVTGAGAAGAFHTVLDVGTSKAAGKKPDTHAERDEIIDAIYDQFETRAVVSVGHPEQRVLVYWGTASQYANSPPADTAALLLAGDGPCGAWQDFMYEVCSAQGVTPVRVNVTPQDFPVILTQGWTLVRKGFEIKPLPAQGSGGGPPDTRRFFNHAVIGWQNHNNVFLVYDPSYGVPAYFGSTNAMVRDQWEQASLLQLTFQERPNPDTDPTTRTRPLMPIGQNVYFNWP